MKLTARALFSLALLAVAGYAVLTALRWPIKAALFPLVTGIPILALVGVQLALELSGRDEGAAGPRVDMQLTADVPAALARRRAVTILAWILGFILVVALVGFPVAVPLFMFSYLAFQSRAGWLLSLGLTAVAWGFFHGLFERLLHLPFEAGWVQTWLGL